MEAIQPVRPPLSQQPPQRIDSDRSLELNQSSKASVRENKENELNKKDINIPDVDISSAYKRKPLRHRIECGVRCKIGSEEINELKLNLGDRKCSMYKEECSMSACVVCDEQCIDGQFAVETVLFIPNKNDAAYDNLGRFRIELPRIACHECSVEYASINSINNINHNQIQLSLGKIWQNYQNGQLRADSPSNKVGAAGNTLNNVNINNQGQTQKDDEKLNIQNISSLSQQQQQHHNNQDLNNPMNPNNNNNSGKQTLPLSEAERDPFDDGFLICTQLVKTGGADQGGLQVGDVFVEFGHYSKKRFPGLKSIANLVRRSAGKEINVVVWRKLEV